MKINVVLDKDAYMPEKAHNADAGFDIRCREEVIIEPHGSPYDSHFFDTGVRVEIPQGYVGFLKSKSGLNVKHGILSTGVIDSGYTGTIGVKLYNLGKSAYHVKKGDKITQLVILPIPEVEMTQINSLEKTERNEGGFGSTGR